MQTNVNIEREEGGLSERNRKCSQTVSRIRGNLIIIIGKVTILNDIINNQSRPLNIVGEHLIEGGVDTHSHTLITCGID